MCNNQHDIISVIILAINVINESTKGNIRFVDSQSRAWSNVSGIEMILDIPNTMISINILPINPAIIAPRALRPISWRDTCFGQNDMSIESYLFL